MSNAALQGELLDLIQVQGALMEKLAEMHAEREATKIACAALIPGAARALVENARIEPHQEKQAAEVLANPAKVLEILTKTAAHRVEAEVPAVGRPVAPQGQSFTKKAGSNNMGRRPSGEIDNATLAMKRQLGLA